MSQVDLSIPRQHMKKPLWIGTVLIFLLIIIWWPFRHTPSQRLHNQIEHISPDYRVLFKAHLDSTGKLKTIKKPLGPWDVPSWLPDGSGLVAWVPIDEQLIIANKDGQEVAPIVIIGEECHLPLEQRTHTCIDPAIIELPNGNWQLYYVYAHLINDPVADSLEEEIHSAISTDLGKTWKKQADARLVGKSLADPDPIVLPDGSIRLYYSTNLDAQGKNIPLIQSAYSNDGLSFKQESGNRIEWASASSVIQNIDGTTHMYVHTLDSSIQLYRSTDGLHFELDSSLHLEFDIPKGYLGAEGPSVFVDDEKDIHILFSSIDEPYFPFNIFLAIETEEERKHHLPKIVD
jgi:hypothetical protein